MGHRSVWLVSVAAALLFCGKHTDSASDGRIWGVTIDNPWNNEATVASLRQLSRRATARIVFDEGQPASKYVPLVKNIHDVASVMGEILDSQFIESISVQGYLTRTEEYLKALGDKVDIWEIGNEINGEWLGLTSDVVAKMKGAYELVKGHHKAAALTLYYNQDCWSSADHEMFTWAEANIPLKVKAGIDWLLVSYYEDDCNNLQPDWPAVFKRLGEIFPNAKLGFGECGTKYADRKEAYLQRYYSMRIDHPRYIGGYFWWYFSNDMVPVNSPLWKTLDNLMKKG